MIQKFIVLKKKYKGTEIIFRRWLDGGKEEIQVDDNFARLMGFPSKEELIKTMLKDTEIDYKEGNTLWACFDESTQKITSVSVSKLEKETHV
jgi:hypothetical protein